MKACGRCCLAPVECYTHHTKRFAHTARGHSSTIDGVTLWSARVGVDSATAERAKARSKSASLFTTAPNRSSALCRRCASCFLAFAISCAVASHTSHNTARRRDGCRDASRTSENRKYECVASICCCMSPGKANVGQPQPNAASKSTHGFRTELLGQRVLCFCHGLHRVLEGNQVCTHTAHQRTQRT